MINLISTSIFMKKRSLQKKRKKLKKFQLYCLRIRNLNLKDKNPHQEKDLQVKSSQLQSTKN